MNLSKIKIENIAYIKHCFGTEHKFLSFSDKIYEVRKKISTLQKFLLKNVETDTSANDITTKSVMSVETGKKGVLKFLYKIRVCKT